MFIFKMEMMAVCNAWAARNPKNSWWMFHSLRLAQCLVNTKLVMIWIMGIRKLTMIKAPDPKPIVIEGE